MVRTAVITGSSSGIGRATAREFSSRGFRVFGLDLSPDPDAGALTFIQADVSREQDVERALRQIEDLVDRLDVLVNNAAICPYVSIVETTTDQWERLLAVNLTGPFLMIRGAVPLLKRVPGSSIVNVASVHALATSKGIAAYAASKGGLVALTRAAALELAGHGIRVNCVLPGAVNTPMLVDGFKRGHLSGPTVEAKIERLAAATPLKRIASPEEIARAICFLSSSEEASFITGQTLVVDGGALARLSTE